MQMAPAGKQEVQGAGEAADQGVEAEKEGIPVSLLHGLKILYKCDKKFKVEKMAKTLRRGVIVIDPL